MDYVIDGCAVWTGKPWNLLLYHTLSRFLVLFLCCLSYCLFAFVGQFLYNAVAESDDLEIAFVWNRSVETLKGKVPEEIILRDLAEFAERWVIFWPSLFLFSVHCIHHAYICVNAQMLFKPTANKHGIFVLTLHVYVVVVALTHIENLDNALCFC